MEAQAHEWAGFFDMLAGAEQTAAWRETIPPDPPILHPGNSPVSFYTATIAQLARWLNAAGFDAERGRTHVEYARLYDGRGGLIVLYYSGSVVVQGAGSDHALATLAQLLRPDQRVEVRGA